MKYTIDAATMEERKKRAAKIIALLHKLYPEAHVSLNARTPWELLVAVVLSAQCTDKKVNEVTATLFKKYKTFESYLRARPADLEREIRPTGFYKNKAKNILAAARMVAKTFHGEVPQTMEALVAIPGVGRKTANIILESAYGIVEGIAVDTHVRRLARLWGLTYENDPEKIEQDLMVLVPRKAWRGLSLRIIAYGREYCPAKAHDHAQCPVSKLKV